MFKLAVLVGVYAYIIFFLGIFSVLTTQNLIFATFIFVLLGFIYIKLRLNWIKVLTRDKYSFILIGLIFISAFVNLIGALGPELAFDALWYHLTIPKIYLLNDSIFFIPGSLLYYSAMPKLGEMLFIPGIAFFGEVAAKITHYFFGLLSGIVLYKLSRLFLNRNYSLITVIIFFSNLVFAWQSITAYIDLIRTFFHILALFAMVNWILSKKLKWVFISGVMMGLEISTKLLGIVSFGIFVMIIAIFSIKERKLFAKEAVVFTFPSLIISAPWFIFSHLNTGNPVYPFFQGKLDILNNINFIFLNPLVFLSQGWTLLLNSSDPISPIYLISIPLVVYFLKKSSFVFKILAFYIFSAFFVWYVTDFIIHGGSRFFLVYLPGFSLLAIMAISEIKAGFIKNYLIGIIFLIFVSSMFYRFMANVKYFPVIIGTESKKEFLVNNLNFSFGDFYDTDDYFKNNILKNEKVLLYGFHNLFYVNFPFIDSSWVKRGDAFNYVATQNISLPNKHNDLEKVYENRLTDVKLYKCKSICLY